MTHIISSSRQISVIVFVGTLSLVVLTGPGMSQAQTPPITESGMNTQVSDPITVGAQTQYNITGGFRPEGGTNLFHSFGDFGVPDNNIANFLNGVSFDHAGNPLPSGLSTSNIIARVTGSSGNNPTLSSIFGTIQTTDFVNANLFLINPAGFLFGPNAKINVGGSANFATADYLRLGKAGKFNAVPGPADALLSIDPVTSFGFLAGNHLGTIQIEGGTVKNTSALTLVGRDKVVGTTVTPGIEVTGTLSNPGGDIRLISVGTPADLNVGGEVTAQTLAPASSQGFTGLGSIEVRNGGVVSTSVPDTSSGGIVIRTGKLTVNDGKLLTDTTRATFQSNQFVTGSIEAHADTVALNGATISTTTSSDFSNSGNIDFSDIGRLTATDSNFSAASFAGAGQIKIGSANTSVIDLSYTSINVSHDIIDLSPLSFGSVELTGSSIALHESDLIGNAFGSGRGGIIRLNGHNIDISGSRLMASDQTGGAGGGEIFLEGLSSTSTTPTRAKQVSLRNGVDITTSTNTSFAAGPIIIRSESMLVDGASVRAEGVGASSPLLVEVGTLTLQNKATLSTRLLADTSLPFNFTATGGPITIHAETITIIGESGILSSVARKGDGGNINISSQSIRMSEGARIDASASSLGTAGNINLNSELIAGDKSTVISTSSTGSGLAGDLSFNSPTSLTIRGMTLETSSDETSGGNIKLSAPDIIRLVNSELTSSVKGQSEKSDGGNINIDPQLVVIQNSQLRANANAGAGGNIDITATGAVLVDPNSLLTATAGPAGVSGSININSPIQVLSGALVPLNLAYGQAGLSGDRCAADATGQFSSFVQAGRDGVPQVPGALSPSPLSFLDTLTSGSWGSPAPNWAAARLGLDSVSLDDSTRYRFHSACHS